MRKFYEGSLDLYNKFKDNENVSVTLMIPPGTEALSKKNKAQLLTKEDTYEYYKIASHQITVAPWVKMEDLEDILSEEGLALYAEALEKVNIGDVKDHFDSYTILISNSGSWYLDSTSRHHRNTDVNMLNSFRNLCVVGIPTKIPNEVQTSPCVFYVHDENGKGWCLTNSGSIYTLGSKVE